MKRIRLNGYLLQFPELGVLYGLVKQDFLTKGLIHHNWSHIQRDLARAITIGEAEKAYMKIVLAGVLLHDIGRLYPELGGDHHARGAKKALEYLNKGGFTNKEIKEIVHCIEAHGPRGLKEPKTLEAKVVYDTDVISCSVDFTGVARVFDYFMREEKMGVKDMMEIPSGRKGPRKDFYTATGYALGERGLRKAQGFWEELRRELKKEEQTVKDTIKDYKPD